MKTAPIFRGACVPPHFHSTTAKMRSARTLGVERRFDGAIRDCADAFRASPPLYYVSGWEGRVAVLKFFGDESFGRRQSGSQGCFVVAGYLADAEAWKSITGAWDIALKTPPAIEYFHMIECFSAMVGKQDKYEVGQFDGFSPRQARAELNSLVSVLEQHRQLIKSAQSVVTWDLFNHALTDVDREVTGSPYYPCLMGVVRGCWTMITQFGPPIPIDFCFDEKQDERDHVLSIWAKVKAMGPYADNSLASVMGSITFADDKLCLPLQCADLFAWHVRRDYIRPAEDHGRTRPEYKRLKSARADAAIYQPNEGQLREERAAIWKRVYERMKLEPTDKLPETTDGLEAFSRLEKAVKRVLSAPKVVEPERAKRAKARRKKSSG